MSMVDWLNSLHSEYKCNWLRIRYDQVPFIFLGALDLFPFVRCWQADFLSEYFTRFAPSEEKLFLICADTLLKDIDNPRLSLKALSITVNANLGAYSMITPFRKRLEQFVDGGAKRTPGHLAEFFEKHRKESWAVSELKRVTADIFSPVISNFWTLKDVNAMQEIRDILVRNWIDTIDEESENKDLAGEYLPYALSARMNLIEFNALMNIKAGEQWIEITKGFIRRTEIIHEGALMPHVEIPTENRNEISYSFLEKVRRKYSGFEYKKKIPNEWIRILPIRGLSTYPYEEDYRDSQE